MRVRPVFAAIAALACGGVVSAADPEHPAEITARATYAWAIAHAGAGLPDTARPGELAALLTPGLLELLAAGRATEERCKAFTPEGEKPPLFEADVFADTYEGAQEVALVKSSIEADTASFDARLFSVSSNFPVAHRYRVVTWQDTMTLRNTADGWRVDDVAFERGDSLRQRVASFIDGNRDCETAQSP